VDAFRVTQSDKTLQRSNHMDQQRHEAAATIARIVVSLCMALLASHLHCSITTLEQTSRPRAAM
jgi:hypothetical protein